MVSPCVRLCTLDAESRMCVGCGRTLAEIGRWSAYSAAERLAIMALLPARLGARGWPTSVPAGAEPRA